MANEPEQDKKPKPFWPATWDEVKEAELDDALRATPAQRLAWLEEAIEFARQAGVLKRE